MSEVFYEVEKIVDMHVDLDGKRKFLISWKGYDESEDSWEPEENLFMAQDLIKEFLASRKNQQLNSLFRKIKEEPIESIKSAPIEEIQSTSTFVESPKAERILQHTKMSKKKMNHRLRDRKHSTGESENKKTSYGIKSQSGTKETCQVCGDDAKKHYGVMSCKHCMAFFYSLINKKTTLDEIEPCDKECNITKRTRSKCKFCRLKKCLAVGMIATGKKSNKKKVQNSKEKSALDYYVQNKIQEAKKLQDSIGGVVETIQKAKIPESPEKNAPRKQRFVKLLKVGPSQPGPIQENHGDLNISYQENTKATANNNLIPVKKIPYFWEQVDEHPAPISKPTSVKRRYRVSNQNFSSITFNNRILSLPLSINYARNDPTLANRFAPSNIPTTFNDKPDPYKPPKMVPVQPPSLSNPISYERLINLQNGTIKKVRIIQPTTLSSKDSPNHCQAQSSNMSTKLSYNDHDYHMQLPRQANIKIITTPMGSNSYFQHNNSGDNLKKGPIILGTKLKQKSHFSS